jgi:acyl dehydratase
MTGLFDWKAGDEVAALDAPPITRATLALYAGASGDHNPIHIDLDAARDAGLEDVIAHGMLVMAYLGRALTEAVDQRRIRAFSTRFVAMTRVGDAVSCRAVVAERLEQDGRPLARLALTACDGAGERKLQGEALIDLADPD